jgi:hypothetical protein
MDDPLPGVRMVMQKGPSATAELIAPSAVRPDALVFDITVSVAGANPDGSTRLLGPFVQGPPTGRFVYLCAGVLAGQPGSPWQRRAKVPLTGLTWPLIESLAVGDRLEAHIAGKGRDGGPAVASVKLLPPGWRSA